MRILLTCLFFVSFMMAPSLFARNDQRAMLIEQTKQVDACVYSFDRPMQLYAYLESARRYLTNVNETHVVYRASNQAYEDGYKVVMRDFSQVIFHKQGPDAHANFKSLVVQSVYSPTSIAAYMMFVVDDMIVKDYADLKVCTSAMEKYNTWEFSLRLGKHIYYCYSHNADTPCPKGEDLRDNMFLWRFIDGAGDWGWPNNTDMSIFRKRDVRDFITNYSYFNPNSLETAWQACANRYNMGVCFKTSKVINIPMNVLNNSDARTTRAFTTDELLRKFQQGYKIDIFKFHQVINNSPHVDYTPEFIHR